MPIRSTFFQRFHILPIVVLPVRAMPWLAWYGRGWEWVIVFFPDLWSCVRPPPRAKQCGDPAGRTRRNPPRPGATTPPKTEKRRAEARGSEADERRRRAGPTEPGGPPPPSRGGRAKRQAAAHGRAGGATPSVLIRDSQALHIVAEPSRNHNSWGSRGPKPPYHGYHPGAYRSARYSMQAS